MNWDGKMNMGKLFALRPNGSLDVLDEGLTIPNGMGWNKTEDTFFMIDTGHQKMYAYDFDKESGRLANKRIFKTFKHDEYPDGMAIDANDHFWIAIWDGARIIRLNQYGEELERIDLPVQYPTSCCFGGDGLKKLYISTSTLLLKETRINQHKDGKVLVFETSMKGKPERRFANFNKF